MRRLIVNADDFGFAAGVNEGIVEAHVSGIVTSTSLMVGRPAAADAARLAREYSALSVGLHYEEDGPEIDEPGHAARTFAAQLARFRELTGAEPTHVDSHHHVHMTRMSTFAPLVAPLGVPLRGDGASPTSATSTPSPCAESSSWSGSAPRSSSSCSRATTSRPSSSSWDAIRPE